MRRYAAIAVGLALISAAPADASPRSQAVRVAQERASMLSAYYKLTAVRDVKGGRSFSFYLRWRNRRGLVCEFTDHPRVVVFRDGRPVKIVGFTFEACKDDTRFPDPYRPPEPGA